MLTPVFVLDIACQAETVLYVIVLSRKVNIFFAQSP